MYPSRASLAAPVSVENNTVRGPKRNENAFRIQIAIKQTKPKKK